MMNMKISPLLIYSGRIIDPSQGIDEIGSLLITEGIISWLGKGEMAPTQPGYNVLHAQGLIICPGFVDHPSRSQGWLYHHLLYAQY